MFENLPSKLKKLAVFTMIVYLALTALLFVMLLITRAAFLNFLGVLLLPVSACITAFPLYGLAVVMEDHEDFYHSFLTLESKLNKLRTEDLDNLRILLERMGSEEAEQKQEPKAPVSEPKSQIPPKTTPVHTPEPRKTLPEALQYALQFSTDKGMLEYLRRYASSSESERSELDALLSGDPSTLRQRVQDRMAQS